MKRVATVVSALAIALAVAANAAAQQPVEYNVTVKADVVKGSPNDHFVTFDAPVQIPDVTLPAGTYVFSVVAPSVLQVSSADRTMKYALFFTAPIMRAEAGEEYEWTIAPTNPTAPGRVTKWFLPNQARGFEFLYPAEAARGDR
jgi:hypothetical protein